MRADSESIRAAAKKALTLRIRAGYDLSRPCNVYELTRMSGIELQFFAVPTLEGMYLEDREIRRICVSSFRPRGRQHFTAAHEWGHRCLGHGTTLDQIAKLRDKPCELDPQEQLADIFATSLLMPSGAVHSGFTLRGLSATKPTPTDVYKVATWLGVGYTTLCNHLCYSMRLIPPQYLRRLTGEEPKNIKSQMARQSTTSEFFGLDRLWDHEIVLCYVGDFLTGITAPPPTLLTPVNDDLFTAASPGKAVVELDGGGSAEIRIARQNYVGFYDYFCLPEED